jgi:hypothetical protein
MEVPMLHIFLSKGPARMAGVLLLGFGLALTAGDARAYDDDANGQAYTPNSTNPKQKLDFAKQASTEIDDALVQVGKLKEIAEKDGDPDKIQCVRNKEASIRALVDVSKRANTALKSALQSNESELAEHEFRKVAVAVSKTRQFLAEAKACVGGGGSVAGNTDVEVTGGGLLDDGELSDGGLDVIEDLPPPNTYGTTFE